MLLSRLGMDLGPTPPLTPVVVVAAAAAALAGSEDDDDDSAATDRWRTSMDVDNVDRYWDEAINALCDRDERDWMETLSD